MKLKSSLLTGALFACSLPLSSFAQGSPGEPDAPPAPQGAYGPKSNWSTITETYVTTMNGKQLGRILDIAVDLPNGRIEEVLVVSDQFLRFGGKIVAIPPNALIPDATNKTYRLDMTEETFKAAPAFDISKENWAASTEPSKVAAAYQYFGQSPNFLIPGEAPGRKALSGRPLGPLGTLDRMTHVTHLPVYNLQGERLGELQGLVLDIPTGRILNAYIRNAHTGNIDPAGNKMDKASETESVVPPTTLSFNAQHDGLLMDISLSAYANEPNVIFEKGAGGQASSSKEEAATGPRTNVPLVQGSGFRDTKITAQIYGLIKDANLDASNKIEVGTADGRVTLRGPVDSQATKDKIGALAISVVNLNNVDNQIVVAPSMQANL